MSALRRQLNIAMLFICVAVTGLTACAPLPPKPQVEARGPHLVYYLMNQPAMQLTHDSAVDCGVEARLEVESMNAQALKAYQDGFVRMVCTDVPVDPKLLPFKSPFRSVTSAKNIEAVFASEATCKRAATGINVPNSRFRLDC